MAISPQPRRKKPDKCKDARRDGKIAVLTAVILVPLFGMGSLAVDATYLMEVKKEAQVSAEAAAIAGAYGLLHPDRLLPTPDSTQAIIDARDNAVAYAFNNPVGVDASGNPLNPQVDRNDANTPNGELVVGHLSTWGYEYLPYNNNNEPWSFSDPNKFNAVQVRVKRTADRNGEVNLFLARIFNRNSAPVEAIATAILERGKLVGFQQNDGEGGGWIIPFALEEEKYLKLFDDTSTAPDNWHWDSETQAVTSGSDGVKEVSLFPDYNINDGDSDGSGNFGTIDIGSSGNSTNDLIRQILYGITDEDLAYHGGELTADPIEGTVYEGDTGISAGMKSALESIIGQPRCIALYRGEVLDPGNNAEFNVVAFVGIVITEVKLSGNPKYITIQPAFCVDAKAVIDTTVEDDEQTVFRPPRLIQ